jgi:iron complex outermembrane receptor protein
VTIYHIRRRAAPLFLATTILASAVPALAQDADPAPAPAGDAGPQSDDDLHSRAADASPEIVVTAHGLKQLDMLAGTTAVEGLELQRSQATQIGEVLLNQPGVSMSGFAPGASRPVLRGFSGNRVKLLIDGIGSIDASNVSDDHAVAVDPFNAERIDVLRGPAVLLYGSQAIGGAVNVIDKRIPLRLPEEPVHFDALVSGNTVADMRQGAASVDAPLGGGFAAHVDGSYSRTNDISVPGFTVAEPLRAQLLGQANAVATSDPAFAAVLRGQANQRDVLPGSGSRTYSANGGVAFFSGDSNLGASLGYYDTYYGVPVRPGTEETEPGHIGLKQWRGDLRAVLALGDGLFDRIESHAAYSHYAHTEFESDGAPGTTFNVEGMEARAELVQAERSDWSGSMGVQYTSRHLDTEGAERILPRNLSESQAVFALQQIPLADNLRVQLAGRYEHATVSAPDEGFDRGFSTVSGALGLTYSLTPGFDIGINANRVARAPSPEELLIDGYHDATQTYERGDPTLGTERAVGGELFARGHVGAADMTLTGFYNHFTGYIYEANTGAIIDGAPVFQTSQGNANYYGAEGELDLPLVRSDAFSVKSELRASYVRAKLEGAAGNVPRIPPLALFGALEGTAGAFTARGEVAWSDSQDKVAAGETPTDGYTFVNASLAWRPVRGNDNVTVLLKADNVFNATGRLATSLTKDYTPLPGRNLEASVRVSF